MKQSPFSFHEGAALLKLAGYYPRILDVLLESVQNCLDKGAQVITIVVNQKQRQIAVRDDGDGVSQQEFEKALTSVSSSIKKKDKLGRFGLGLISPLGKCARFIFTSTTKRNPKGFLEWSFVTDDLLKQQKIEGIPMRERLDLQFSRAETRVVRGVSSVRWRTEVRIEGFTTDRQINIVTMDSLRDGVLERFASTMRKNQSVIELTVVDEDGERQSCEIRAKDFTGRKLEEVDYRDRESGQTHFRLFLAQKDKKGKRNGKVLVGEKDNDFRLNFSTFNRSLPEACKLSDELVSALGSGLFEGEVLNSAITLHASRRSFEADESLVGFCVILEKWFAEHGAEHYQDANDQRQEERYQQLGIRSMKVIEEMLKRPQFAGLLKAIESFKKGSIGPGHFEKKGSPSPETSLAVNNLRPEKPSNGEGEGNENFEPEKERPEHRPMTVVGPKGTRRTIVRSNSLGLQLVHDAIQGSDRLWVLEEETGTLRINVLHPLWQQCEEHSDRTLMRFQEYVMLQALALRAAPSDWAPFAELVLEETYAPYVFMLIHGDTIAGRQFGGRRGKKILDSNVKDQKSSDGKSQSKKVATKKRRLTVGV